MIDEQDVVGFVYRGQSFVLGQVALQFDHFAELQKVFAETGLLDMANEAEAESGLHLRRQRLHGLNQRSWFC